MRWRHSVTRRCDMRQCGRHPNSHPVSLGTPRTRSILAQLMIDRCCRRSPGAAAGTVQSDRRARSKIVGLELLIADKAYVREFLISVAGIGAATCSAWVTGTRSPDWPKASYEEHGGQAWMIRGGGRSCSAGLTVSCCARRLYDATLRQRLWADLPGFRHRASTVASRQCLR